MAFSNLLRILNSDFELSKLANADADGSSGQDVGELALPRSGSGSLGR